MKTKEAPLRTLSNEQVKALCEVAKNPYLTTTEYNSLKEIIVQLTKSKK